MYILLSHLKCCHICITFPTPLLSNALITSLILNFVSTTSLIKIKIAILTVIMVSDILFYFF
jgi:hypothetical protein